MTTLNLPEIHYTLTDIRVRYAETDAMGIVHHSSYWAWFELGRTDLGHRIGAPYKAIEARGIHYPLVECHCYYKNPAFYDDHLIVRTTIGQVRTRTFVFNYELVRKDDRALIAIAYTKHVAINHNKKPIRLPDDLYRLYLTYDTERLTPAPA